jgi:aspartate aminotransferase
MTQASRTSAAAARIATHSQRPATRPGPDIIALSSGDPDFETPAHIREALIAAIESGYTHYVDNQGDPELRAALAEQVACHAGRPVGASEILVAHGASGAISAAFLATVDPGDRVVLPEPTYSVYADVLHLIGAEPVFVPTDREFHLDFERLEQACIGAQMIVICNPCNPTGVVYRRDEMEQLAELANRHDLLVFSDEAYERLVFDGVEFTSSLAVPALQDRLIYCASLSKTYAMTGWRVGYLAGPPAIIRESARMHRTINSSLNAAVQRAALAAVTTPSDWPERMRQEYQARRALVVETLRNSPGFALAPPDGAFYAFIRNPSGLTSQQMVEAALEYGVAVRAGSEYGPSGEGYFRITFATGREALTEGLHRLRRIGEAALRG